MSNYIRTMLMLNKFFSASAIVLCISTTAISATQNLDEVMGRKSRYSTNTFSSGEGVSPTYYWQPETLQYNDSNYGTEIWRMTFKPDSSDDYSNEYSTMAWSGDGSRLGFRSISTNIRNSSDPNEDGGSTPRWTMNSDGSGMRAGTTLGGGRGHDYLNWLSTERAAYLFTPGATTEFPGADRDTLYKVSLDASNEMSREVWIPNIGGDSLKSSLIKDPITSDDRYMILQDEAAGDWPTPLDINSRKIYVVDIQNKSVVTSWGAARGIGPTADPYGATTNENQVFLRGSSSAFLNNPGGTPSIYAHFSNFTPHFEWKITGSASDGGPAYADWDGDSFGANDEIKALDDNAALSVDLPHNPYDNGYMGHPAFDRWGKYVLANNSHDCNHIIYGSDPTRYIRWGNNGCPGLMVLDVKNNLSNPSWVDANNSNYMIGTGTSNVYKSSHSSWTAWSDWIVSMDGRTFDLYKNNYQKTNQTGKTNTQASEYFVTTELSYHDNYAAYPRPSQSPDGTKVAFSTILFSSSYDGTAAEDDKISISSAVAYYPHPPEIISVTGSGTYTIRFDWRTDQTTSRGYTQRGWPDEATDDPPPPRETKLFRLWRSSDGTTGWTPAGTVEADIFNRYNFATGVWSGNKYWEIADTPGAGTWYYAVTSQEWSGLESHTLSNVFSTAGSQTSAYPSDPKADSDFVTTHQSTLVRHYNIYAADGATPTATQQDRIASIPVASAGEYVDWLGDTAGTTQYLVTAVDTQGNESAPISSAREVLPTAGQYRVSWGGGRRLFRNFRVGEVEP